MILLKSLIPSKSALIHFRFAFSFFLMPVYFFAISQASAINISHAILVFIIWHLFIYPASNGYNSYFDKDEGSIALVEKPPQVDISLYYTSLLTEMIGILLSLLISFEFALSTLIYGLLSKAYSHPAIRLKKYPIISFLVVFIFQGGFVYWTTLSAVSEQSVFMLSSSDFFIAGLICSCLIGASYPLTQVYQHEEDRKRGDKTLSLLLGIKGTFMISALLFAAGTSLLYIYWSNKNTLQNFWIFLAFALPVFAVFLNWLFKVLKKQNEANFKNMMLMTTISGLSMLLYFLLLCFKK
ncbi:MAG: Ubiquinone biosynthesis protein UbiA [Sphingobacteriales bacterium]|nr:Ubiquinone biosynthesis protein UbiA [Sphingobacteriales bacterium]